VESVDELLKLREDKRLVPLVSTLRGWFEAGRDGQLDVAQKIGVDVKKAEKDLKSMKKVQLLSDVASIVSIPVGIVDAILGTPFGLALTPIGPAVSLWTRSRTKKFGWLRFGEPD
jgi:hypothetical protein